MSHLASNGAPALPPSGLLSLGMANGLALLAAVSAASLYARWLGAAEFAHWAGAMALAKAALLLLDGGLKTALVRRGVLPPAATLSRLTRLCGAAALGLATAVAALACSLWAGGHLDAAAALLMAAYSAAYLLSYPPLLAPLARLERARQFRTVGRAEATSVVVEFALPAALITAGLAHAAAFVVAVCLARLLRTAWIVVAARELPEAAADAGPGHAGAPVDLLREGVAVQAVAGLSMLRDQSALWLLAPWFGAVWGGTYSFAATAFALVAQTPVQTAARVALPALRQASAAGRWPQVLAQTRWVTIAAMPPVLLLPAWLAWANQAWWGGQWQQALEIVPWMVPRMLAGMATTTLGAWLLVARAPAYSARSHAAWTATEIACAVAALAWLGPAGLAIAGAFSAWAGVALFLHAAEPTAAQGPRWQALLGVLLLRPSVWVAAALALLVHAQAQWLPLATAALPLAWLCEPTVREWARHWGRRSWDRWHHAQP